MTKVVHLTSAHPPDDVRIFYKQCLSLQQLGYQVVLIAPAIADGQRYNVVLRAVKKSSSRLRRMSLSLWAIYRMALRESAEIYHFHDPDLLIVGLLLRCHGKKVIYDVHEDVPRDILIKTWLPAWFRPTIAKFFEKFELLAARYFHAIVSVTPLISSRFAHLPVVEVRNYPILAEFQCQFTETKTVNLCYTGLIMPERGIREMVQAMQRCGTTLLLAGNFTSHSLQQEITIAKPVNYLGYVNRQQLANIYANSLAGLALLHPGPTFNDSLPIKLFEYMAAGIPVIASDFPLWRDIIEKHACGFCVNPQDINAICQRIVFLKEHPDQAQIMGERGKLAVAKYYNWQTQAVKLANTYQKILTQA